VTSAAGVGLHRRRWNGARHLVSLPELGARASTVGAVGLASTATCPAVLVVLATRSATEVAAPTRSPRLSDAAPMRQQHVANVFHWGAGTDDGATIGGASMAANGPEELRNV
jgi:hypothetical protein